MKRIILLFFVAFSVCTIKGQPKIIDLSTLKLVSIDTVYGQDAKHVLTQKISKRYQSTAGQNNITFVIEEDTTLFLLPVELWNESPYFLGLLMRGKEVIKPRYTDQHKFSFWYAPGFERVFKYDKITGVSYYDRDSELASIVIQLMMFLFLFMVYNIAWSMIKFKGYGLSIIYIILSLLFAMYFWSIGSDLIRELSFLFTWLNVFNLGVVTVFFIMLRTTYIKEKDKRNAKQKQTKKEKEKENVDFYG